MYLAVGRRSDIKRRAPGETGVRKEKPVSCDGRRPWRSVLNG